MLTESENENKYRMSSERKFRKRQQLDLRILPPQLNCPPRLVILRQQMLRKMSVVAQK